jgi:hypothetical protein
MQANGSHKYFIPPFDSYLVLHIELNVLHIESRSSHDNAGSARKQLHISYD